jgi:glycosyltransferase involved in cell wall biosynthesis
MTMRAALSPSSKDRRPGQMQIRPLIRDGVTGLLCEPGDAVDLARRFARLLDDQTLRRQMGLAGAAAI